MDNAVSIFWFRRDLRLDDNAGLYHALRSGNAVLPVFIFDKDILDDLPEKKDIRVTFIYTQLEEMQKQLKKYGSTLHVIYSTPLQAFTKLVDEYDVKAVYTNTDYEPYATSRDKEIAGFLEKKKIEFKSYKDQVIFHKDEVVKNDGKPYTVFTPYSRRWLQTLTAFHLKPYPTEKYFKDLLKHSGIALPTFEEIGFERVETPRLPEELNRNIAEHYDKTRNYPGQEGTTRMDVYLRFGTISIRKLMKEARELNTILVNELIWREFYQMVLWHFPHVVNHAYNKAYDKIEWRNNEAEFKKWCDGETGYPIVDAGMRQLNTIGFMHNRVRLIAASFLIKDLLIDWRWGEAYFADKLYDYDLASNNGNWQWVAGTGADAAPFFRVFNPDLQTKRFDKHLEYIKEWVPEYGTDKYPKPMVAHSEAKTRCLEAYRKAVKKS